MPIFGFNTDIKVGKTVFHVQTEDRGVNNPVLDTTIYVKGRVLAKRATSYEAFLASPDFSEAELHSMLERQHKQIMDEVRTGSLVEMAQFEAQHPTTGISVQLLNPGTFVRGTTATLQLQATKRQEKTPLAGAKVQVSLHTGSPQPHTFEIEVNGEGKAELQFHMPRLGPGGAELLIQAIAPEGRDEVKYTLRPKRKSTS